MKYHYAIWLLTPLFFSCNGKPAASSAHSKEFGAITEYQNSYNEAGQLVYVLETQYHYIGKDTVLNGTQEHIYQYDAGKLKLKETYNVESANAKALYARTKYNGGEEECITYRNGSQDSYTLEEKDAQMNVIRRVVKRRLIAPEFDMNINDDYEECTEYSAKGVPVYAIRYDFAAERCTQTYYTTDKAVCAKPRSRRFKLKEQVIETIEKEVATAGDTTITRRYCNKQLEEIRKEIVRNGRTVRFEFNAQGEQTFYTEQLKQNGITIDIFRLSSTNTVDSLFYKGATPLRDVSQSGEELRITTYEYDSHGNPTREVMVVRNTKDTNR